MELIQYSRAHTERQRESEFRSTGTLKICKLNSFKCEILLLGNSLNAHRFNSKHKFGLMGVWACQKWSLSQHEITFYTCSFFHSFFLYLVCLLSLSLSLSFLILQCMLFCFLVHFNPQTKFLFFRIANSTINIVEKCGKMQRKTQNK